MATPIYSYLKRRLYARYTHRIDTPIERKRSEFFAEWIDVGFARHRWTNDGEIAPGVFRSNNPDEKRFKAYADQGIRTVVNLRHDVGRSPVKLAEERAGANGMTYTSFPMHPRSAPQKDTLLGLVELFQTIEKPVLFHCKSGADRTGLVAAIWRIEQEREPLSIARSELSIKYIHRRDSETGVLDEVLDGYEPFEATLSFKDWVERHYDPAIAEQNAARFKPRRGVFGTLRHFFKDVYQYAQHREARWHRSFEKAIETDAERKRAKFFMTWIDHEILRRFWHNHHEIGTGVFRSNHPTEARFRKYAAEGLKTVINLRGADMSPQYQLEKKICADLGLDLFDISMAGTVAPSRVTLLELLDIFENADRPMMMHCKSGADRTGLASALYKLSIGQSVRSAIQEFSLKYIHLKNGNKGVLQWILLQYEEQGEKNGVTLREWIACDYDADLINRSFRAFRGNWTFPVEARVDAGGIRSENTAIVTFANNDVTKLEAWVSHYDKQVGHKSLFVVIDGFDQQLPDIEGVNFLITPKGFAGPPNSKRQRRKRLLGLEVSLRRSFDNIMTTDINEPLQSGLKAQSDN